MNAMIVRHVADQAAFAERGLGVSGLTPSRGGKAWVWTRRIAFGVALGATASSSTSNAAPSRTGVLVSSSHRTVHPTFNLSSPAASPFPSDRFTVADGDQLTGRRVALPSPADCVANASECRDVTFLNRLDGFNLTPRIVVPFDGEIDVASVTPKTVFLVPLGDAAGSPPRDSARPPTDRPPDVRVG